ncbi:MAG TPA: 4-hydroxy-tetrahydrodipicolinate reductase, partial [Acidobacteriota bacterium]|nr:4-hydroxy-tetrahydrodipicolinate reductase [Acidobacteriota bacterium]
MSTPRLILNGAKGRMGHALLAAAADLKLPVAAALDAGDDLAAALSQGDVVIDFSAHSATRRVIELTVAQKKALVIGTTGHSADEKKKLAALAAQVPTVWAGN